MPWEIAPVLVVENAEHVAGTMVPQMRRMGDDNLFRQNADAPLIGLRLRGGDASALVPVKINAAIAIHPMIIPEPRGEPRDVRFRD